MNKVELLAPAGDLDRLKMAFHYGADAVYLGGKKFSLRANAKNLTDEELKEAADIAKSLNKSLYITVNILFHNDDLEGLDEYLKYLDTIGITGIISSDIVVIKKIRELNLNLNVVLSTQSSTLNYGAVMFWKSLGVKRVVLAREASREDVKRIIDETGIEVETFIHGAMCTSISGKCVLSNYLTNRDSNRGGCVQACRWCFKNNDNPEFTMTSKDLNMVSNIKDMIDLGVASFKVEGRMRSSYYIATVILAYRKMIDKVMNGTLTDEETDYYLNVLNRCANRDSKPQFYNNPTTEEDEYWLGRNEVTNKDFLGIVLDYDEETHIATIEQRNYFEPGTKAQIFGPEIDTFDYIIENIYDEEMNEIDVANHPQMIVKLKIMNKVYKDDIIRLKVFDKIA